MDRKRASMPNMGSQKGKAMKSGILKRNHTKKTRRSVNFCDMIGKPLVEYREVPPLFHDEEHPRVNFEESRGKYITIWPKKWPEVEWKLIEIDRNGKEDKDDYVSEVYLKETERLEREGISRAPLFGTYDVIDTPSLAYEANARAMVPVKIIPCDMQRSTVSGRQIRDLPLPGKRITPPVYRQVDYQHNMDHEQYIAKDPYKESITNAGLTTQGLNMLLNELMGNKPTTEVPIKEEPVVVKVEEPEEQETQEPPAAIPEKLQKMLDELRKKGFMNDEQTNNDNNNNPSDMATTSSDGEPRRKWTQCGWKINQLCTYYLYRPNGCNRGDMCRFLHDSEQKKVRLEQEQLYGGPSTQGYMAKDENWRRPPMPPRMNGGMDNDGMQQAPRHRNGRKFYNKRR